MLSMVLSLYWHGSELYESVWTCFHESFCVIIRSNHLIGNRIIVRSRLFFWHVAPCSVSGKAVGLSFLEKGVVLQGFPDLR